jgi:hypothetical protein
MKRLGVLFSGRSKEIPPRTGGQESAVLERRECSDTAPTKAWKEFQVSTLAGQLLMIALEHASLNYGSFLEE